MMYAAAMATNSGMTSIRVKTETRDRLSSLLASSGGKSLDDMLQRLMDDDFKRKAIEDFDQFREQDPEGWRQYCDDADEGVGEWGRQLRETEGPYVFGDLQQGAA